MQSTSAQRYVEDGTVIRTFTEESTKHVIDVWEHEDVIGWTCSEANCHGEEEKFSSRSRAEENAVSWHDERASEQDIEWWD